MTVADRSDYLPTIFGHMAEPGDMYALDVSAHFFYLSYDLLVAAARDTVTDAGNDIDLGGIRMAVIEARSAEVKRILADASLTFTQMLAKLMPSATWYMIQGTDGGLQFIVSGDRVWIDAPRRALRVSKADALAAIYAAYAEAGNAIAAAIDPVEPSLPYIGSHLLIDAGGTIFDSGSMSAMRRVKAGHSDVHGELRVVENRQAWMKPKGWGFHGHEGPSSSGARYIA